ncbi:hypothetical protein HOD75_01525 [archaeon]|jgi:hypothetical protein|nr:hypothetical protein [archaeon]MBT4241558.1 hypothetical protein [archaeon]MBT4417570.1 hypothetical protein [archaeon]
MSNRYPKWSEEEIKSHLIESPEGVFLPFNYSENIARAVKWRDRQNLGAFVDFVNGVNSKSNDFYLSGMAVMGCLTQNPRAYPELEIISTFTYKSELPRVRKRIRENTNHVPYQGELHPCLEHNGRRFILDKTGQDPEEYSELKLIPHQNWFNPFKQSPITLKLCTQEEFDGNYFGS